MVVAGVGAVFMAGPIGGVAAGIATGAFLGGLAGWGVHDAKIRHYEKLVGEGKVLVVAHGDPLQVAHAHRILKETGSIELHSYAGSDSPV